MAGIMVACGLLHDSEMTRRTFLRAAGCGGACAWGAAKERPNVVFIISDQLHHAAACTTPNLDRLGREVVRFENAVCATPFRSPTRASFLTGV